MTIKLRPSTEEDLTFESAIKMRAKALICDLIDVNWNQIRDLQDEDGKSGFSVSAEIYNGMPANVKTKISFSQKFKDEAESRVDDPRQEKIKFEGEK